MQVHYISFSAHADYAHGGANEMGRLKQKLISLFGNTKIIPPENCQSVEMYFNSMKMAKSMGKLAVKVHGQVTVKHLSLYWAYGSHGLDGCGSGIECQPGDAKSSCGVGRCER
ncbi:Cleavage and polyadenylation specificity factor subunit 3-I [Sarracenia purpurea var. burkii]